ncbi:MAG: exodeoxyribonuclease III [Anaerolineaceae bacterium]|nr:exodeoxyribonuclease III [Anaerolineaceae bacterium]
MKVSTWNVNGIRAALKKGLHQWAASNLQDIICLQEIKARPEQIDEELREISGFYSYWNPAIRPGYSGVASYSRHKPDSIKIGLGIPFFDDEGRVIRMKFPDFVLYNIYFPNGQRSQARVDFKLDFYAHLLMEIDQLHKAGENIIVTGDFNTAHSEIDLANPKQNINNSGFLREERDWIDTYLAHNFVDAYREIYPARIQYTWWTYRSGARRRNIGWRLDYFLVSKNMMSRVRDVVIEDKVEGSDHCPVTIDFQSVRDR